MDALLANVCVATICVMVGLKKFDCNGCSLTFLPEEFGALTALNTLDLRNNQLNSNSFPRSFNQLQNLVRLYLSNNQLESLPETFLELKNLTELDISNNQIYTIWDEITAMTQLERLSLNGNKIDSLAPTIKYAPPAQALF